MISYMDMIAFQNKDFDISIFKNLKCLELYKTWISDVH